MFAKVYSAGISAMGVSASTIGIAFIFILIKYFFFTVVSPHKPRQFGVMLRVFAENSDDGITAKKQIEIFSSLCYNDEEPLIVVEEAVNNGTGQ